MPDFQTVCRVDEIPRGGARLFAVGETMVGVFRLGDEFFALQNECPHAGASLAHGLIDGDTVACRIHHWRFCIRNGTYLDEDRPAYNAPTYTVRIVDEKVQITTDH